MALKALSTSVLAVILTVTALATNAALSVSAVEHIRQACGSVVQHLELGVALRGLHTSITDAELGVRNFMLVRDPHALAPYVEAQQEFREELHHVVALTDGNPALRQRVDAIALLAEERWEEFDRLQALPPEEREQALAGIQSLVQDPVRVQLADALQDEMHAVMADARQALQDREEAARQAVFTARVTIGTGLAASLALLAATLLLLHRRWEERRQAEAHLEAARARLHTTLNSMGDAVVVTDAAGHITFLNPVAQSLTGWGQDALGRPLEEVLQLADEASAGPVENPVARVLRQDAVVKLGHATLLRCRDGTQVPIEDSGAPIRAGDGSMEGVVLVFRDVRERRRAERQLAEQAVQLSDQTHRAHEFLAILSHELRTPLAPIRNAVLLLRHNAGLDAHARRAVEIIERQVNHVVRLVDDLLDVSRVTRGKVRLNPERVDLAELVRRTVEDHRAALEGLHVEVLVPESPLWTRGDRLRLVQAIGNLITNAGKFTPAGGHVSVRLERTGDMATLEVTDTGMGIEATTISRLFQPFSQAERTLERTRGGLGLGLSLVKGFVELHDGQVEVTSPGPGKGTCFRVRLPVRDDLPEAPAPLPVHRPTPRRVLVIEDNQDAADTLRDVLEEQGHQVTVAYTGPEGLEAARQTQPEVVLCDIGLPGLDGYGVARALRQESGVSHAYLAALTGYTQPEDEERARAAGFDTHLAKPPELDKLLRVLEDAPGRTGSH